MKNILVAIIFLSALNLFPQSNAKEIKKTFYPNGNVKSIGEYANDLRHGSYQKFYESGSLWKDWHFTNGLEEGKGTGLGLSIVSSIIDMHKGKLEIKNNKNGGVKVTVMLKA